MNKNSQGRKWLLTENNPADRELSHDVIIQKLLALSFVYFCMTDEIGESGTYHTHIFLCLQNSIRFSTLKKAFPTAHIDRVRGSCSQNRDYLTKSGKWADTDKAETTVEGTFCEYGEMPSEREEKSPELAELMDSFRNGLSVAEAIEQNPKFALRIRNLTELQQTLLWQRYKCETRSIEVAYIYGGYDSDKKRDIYAANDLNQIYCLTNYRDGKTVYYDNYSAEDIMLLDDFGSQIPIRELLTLISGYPKQLSARYADRTACYTKLYILSTIPLCRQYPCEDKEIWNYFLKHINTVLEYRHDGVIIEHNSTEFWR